MDVIEAMKARHSVRSYTDQRIEGDVLAALQAEIAACNEEGGLHIQLAVDEPDGFSGALARYGRFSNVRNYLAMVGLKGEGLEERVGYYGERIVLKAQQLGLNTCWVALTFNKRKAHYVLADGEKLVIVIAIGYGTTQGVPHKSKPLGKVAHVSGAGDWFARGAAAALLAPTAINQQQFWLERDGEDENGMPRVKAVAKRGTHARVDLGIVKYHFEQGAGAENFVWA